MNEAITDRKPAPFQEIEDDVHGIVANIFPCVLRRSRLPSQIQFEIGGEPSRTIRGNPPCLLTFGIPPLVNRRGLNPQEAATRALAQAQDDIRVIRFDNVDELTPVKSDREDDFLKPASLRELSDNLLGDIIMEAEVRAKAVNEKMHEHLQVRIN